jgi:hypothetical protein
MMRTHAPDTHQTRQQQLIIRPAPPTAAERCSTAGVGLIDAINDVNKRLIVMIDDQQGSYQSLDSSVRGTHTGPSSGYPSRLDKQGSSSLTAIIASHTDKEGDSRNSKHDVLAINHSHQ